MAGPGSQISLEYQFTPDPRLEALEVWVSGFVEYQMEGTDEAFQLVCLFICSSLNVILFEGVPEQNN